MLLPVCPVEGAVVVEVDDSDDNLHLLYSPLLSCRVLMRQDLMRQQALEEERKEAQVQLLRSNDTSSPISVSLSSPSRPPAQVPVEVLKVGGGERVGFLKTI